MAAKSGGHGADKVDLATEVEAVKRLLILILLRDGASQLDIAKALGVNQSSISRMFPGGLGKRTKKS